MLTHEYPPYVYGGVGTFTYDLARSLSSKGTSVSVMAGYPAGAANIKLDGSRKTEKNLEVIRIPRLGLPPSQLWYEIMNLARIRSILAKFDIIHSHCGPSFPMIFQCKRDYPKLPWVVTMHTNPVSQLYYATKSVTSMEGSIGDIFANVVGFPIWDLGFRVHASLADAVVAVSQHLARELREEYGVNPRKLFTINTGVNLRTLGEAYEANFSSQDEDKPVKLLFAGRLYWPKGVLYLLRALVSLNIEFRFNNYRLEIFGDGPLRRRILSFISKFHLEKNVKLMGFVRHTELLDSMANSNIVCVPSLYEACPVGMIEAMALGKPVIAFDRPFARELLSGVPHFPIAKNIREYARLLYTFCTSPDLRDEFGNLLRKHTLELFDVDTVAEKYLRVYRGLS